jgi:hypothetical protein
MFRGKISKDGNYTLFVPLAFSTQAYLPTNRATDFYLLHVLAATAAIFKEIRLLRRVQRTTRPVKCK